MTVSKQCIKYSCRVVRHWTWCEHGMLDKTRFCKLLVGKTG